MSDTLNPTQADFKSACKLFASDDFGTKIRDSSVNPEVFDLLRIAFTRFTPELLTKTCNASNFDPITIMKNAEPYVGRSYLSAETLEALADFYEDDFCEEAEWLAKKLEEAGKPGAAEELLTEYSAQIRNDRSLVAKIVDHSKMIDRIIALGKEDEAITYCEILIRDICDDPSRAHKDKNPVGLIKSLASIDRDDLISTFAREYVEYSYPPNREIITGNNDPGALVNTLLKAGERDLAWHYLQNYMDEIGENKDLITLNHNPSSTVAALGQFRCLDQIEFFVETYEDSLKTNPNLITNNQNISAYISLLSNREFFSTINGPRPDGGISTLRGSAFSHMVTYTKHVNEHPELLTLNANPEILIKTMHSNGYNDKARSYARDYSSYVLVNPEQLTTCNDPGAMISALRFVALDNVANTYASAYVEQVRDNPDLLATCSDPDKLIKSLKGLGKDHLAQICEALINSTDLPPEPSKPTTSKTSLDDSIKGLGL